MSHLEHLNVLENATCLSAVQLLSLGHGQLNSNGAFDARLNLRIFFFFSLLGESKSPFLWQPDSDRRSVHDVQPQRRTAGYNTQRIEQQGG